MKGLGWLIVGAGLLSILAQCSSSKKSPPIVDYCNAKGDGTFIGQVISGTPTNGGILVTVVNPSQSGCPFKAVINNRDANRVGVGTVIRFQGTMNGPYLSVRELEINPRDGVGLGPSYVEAKVIVERWMLFENMNWDRSSWFQLNGGEHDGERLSISPRMRSEITNDGCWMLAWNSNDEVVGVRKCSL